MGDDRSSEIPYLRGLGIIDKRFRTTDSLWAGQSSYTEQNPRVGVAVPQQSTSNLRLETSGTQSSGGKLRVKGAAGGHPRPGQGGVTFYKDGESTEWGHNPPVSTRNIQHLSWLDGGGLIERTRYPDAVGLDSDVGVTVAAFKSTSSYGVRVWVTGGAGDTQWDSGSALFSTTAVPPTDMDYRAAVADGGDGVVYVAHWVFDLSASKAQIQVHRSTDSGTTWAVLTKYALKESIDTSTYTVGRLKLAIVGSQALLLMSVKDTGASNYEDQLWQYASDSRARFFEQVEVYDSTDAVPVGAMDCVAIDGGFVVGYVGATGLDALYVRRLPFAAAKLSEQDEVAASSVGFTYGAASGIPSSIDDDDFALVADTNGALYVLARIVSGRTDECVVVRSHDGGLTWSPMGNSELGSRYGKWWDCETAGYHPDDFAAAWVCGQLAVLCNHQSNGGTYEDSVSCLWLGGYSDLTYPGTENHNRDDERVGLNFTWMPWALPSVMGWSKTGAGTTTITSNGTLQIVTSSQSAYYAKTSVMPGTTAEGQTVVFGIKVNSGGNVASNAIAFRVGVGDGSTTNFTVSVRFTTTQMRVRDDAGAADLATISLNMSADFVWFKASIDDGELSIWYRTTHTGDRDSWTEILGGQAVGDGGGANSHILTFGNITGATADSEWIFVGAVSDEYNNPALASGFTNPDDLMPRFLGGAGRRVYINDGVRVMATSGPVDEGEEHHIDARGDYPIDRLWYSASPTRRRGWRSVDTASDQDVAWYYDSGLTGSGHDSKSMSDTVAFVIMDTSARDIEVYGITGGGPPTTTKIADTDTIIASGRIARLGSSAVFAGSLTESDNVTVWPGMLQGGTLRLGSTYRKISENTGGAFQPAANVRRCVLTLEDVDSGDATSAVAAEVWSPHVCIVINLLGVEYVGFMVRFKSTTTATSDLRASFAIPFWVAPMGFLDDNGWAKEDRPGVEIDEGPDLVERPVEVGPARRILEMQFSAAMDLTQFNGAGAEPDFIAASANSGAEPIASFMDTVPTMQGLLRQGNGRDCMLVIERLDKVLAAGSDVTTLRSYGEEFMLATQTGPVRLEHIFGQRLGTSDDEHGELVRGGRVAFREVT